MKPGNFFAVQISFDYDRFGNEVHHFADTFLSTDRMEEAFKVCRAQGGTVQAVVNNFGGKQFVVRRTPLKGPVDIRSTFSPENLSLIDLYVETIGQEAFELQLADDSFSINLDKWFENFGEVA